MTNIFLITGQSGQWDDEQNWNVCWFDNLSNAEEYMGKLQEIADKLGYGTGHELDPNYTFDSLYKATYSIVQLEKGDLGKLLNM
jgi:hypothetical protein